MRLFSPRRRSSWELVDRKSVAPVFTFDFPGDYDHVDILNVRKDNIQGRYIFDITPEKEHKLDQFIRNALIFSRVKLVEQTSKHGWNSFVIEGWELTTYRKGTEWRIEIVYTARPALLSESEETRNGSALPPFLNLTSSSVY